MLGLAAIKVFDSVTIGHLTLISTLSDELLALDSIWNEALSLHGSHASYTCPPPTITRLCLVMPSSVKQNRSASVERPLPSEPLAVTVRVLVLNIITLILKDIDLYLRVCRYGVGSGHAEVVLGGVDRAHYSGNFTFTPTLHSDDGFWTIQLDR